MSNIVVLSSIDHRNLRVDRRPAASYGDNQRFVQVVIQEFPQLVVHYPILLSKDSETGAFFCGAMHGFDPEENLFLAGDGPAAEPYRPLNLQRGPFFASRDGTLAIDLGSPRVGAGTGEPLFDDDGRPTRYAESIAACLGELRRGIEMTGLFIATLVDHKLIEPIDIELSFDDGERRTLEGLYTIDQEALRALPDDTVIELFRRGYLQLIYLMIASLKQVAVLAKMRNDRLSPAPGALR